MSILRNPFLCAALLGLGAASAARAQTPPADTARFYRHHLGLTASPQLDKFFTANRSLPVGLLYKRQTQPHALWRFGLMLNQDYRRRDENQRPVPNLKSNEEYEYNNRGASASVGREFTHRFSPRWTGTAGADLVLGFSFFTHTVKQQYGGDSPPTIPPTPPSPPFENEQTDYFRQYHAAFMPFVGLRFAVQPRLYVSAESSVNAAYSWRTIKSDSKVTDLLTGEVLGRSGPIRQVLTDQTFALRFKLVNQLSVHYQFGR
ncbi:hypothetical protein BEN47_10590 [Hymenobacter lapidarius]|uniref:Outer membrane protein beta-barrel domain-containing protein n=1 Tax=Hymenobacter lapidarius TaxID=1908237 RepID=A0A1G1T9B8_9BACT|nr:hypothetical protein [Hymenobacter lapidarius]OGX87478.1 hypothetical protein BEN47_10590 [Hymenobacter lapidarius]